MSKISKTAAASAVKTVKESKTETVEQSIRQIRLDRAAVPPLYVPGHRIDLLLADYDARGLALTGAEAEVDELNEEIVQLRKVLSIHGITVVNVEVDLEETNGETEAPTQPATEA